MTLRMELYALLRGIFRKPTHFVQVRLPLFYLPVVIGLLWAIRMDNPLPLAFGAGMTLVLLTSYLLLCDLLLQRAMHLADKLNTLAMHLSEGHVCGDHAMAESPSKPDGETLH